MQGFWDYAGLAMTVLFGVAQVFIGFGILWETVERAVLWLRGHRAHAVIAAVGEERDGDSHRVYRPTVEFATSTGELRRAALADTVTVSPAIGARLTVVYRPNEPEYVDAIGVAKGIGSLLLAPILVVVGAWIAALSIAYLLGLDGVRLWAEQALGDTFDWLERTLGGPLGWVRDVLVDWYG
ncbi:DUF3592 domain-containing protein [Nocardia jiangsuensis]|uniref:DUF3592 domain-containing protein n=1 Tax=Nocardia jiangsuensis TaxID=1691563 RepID=UPI00366B424C